MYLEQLGILFPFGLLPASIGIYRYPVFPCLNTFKSMAVKGKKPIAFGFWLHVM